MRIRCALAALLLSGGIARADSRGDWIDSDLVGVDLAAHDFDRHATTTVADVQTLSDFVGLHYYVIDHVRVGMAMQFGEQLAPAPPAGTGHFQTFALLPQIGWNFYGPLYASLAATLAPWTGGRARFDAGARAQLGAIAPLTPRIGATFAVEAGASFVQSTAIGATALVGLTVAL